MCKDVLQSQQRLPNSRSNSSLVIVFFLWTGTTKSRVSFVLEQIERSVEPHCQTYDTDVWRNCTSSMFFMLNFSRKEMSSPRRASRPFTFVARPRQKKPSLILFWHEISFACSPRCVVGLIGTLEIGELIFVKVRNCQTEDLANMAHRRDLTVSGNRVRVNEESWKNHCSSVTRSRLFSKSWRRTQTSWRDFR